MEQFYTLDKLIVKMRLKSKCVDSLFRYWRYSGGDRFGLLDREWVGCGVGSYHDNLTIRLSDDVTFYFGAQPYGEPPSDFYTTCKLEFNPAKVRYSLKFDEFYQQVIQNCKHLDFKQFDVAIDIPCERSRVHMFKDRRNYRLLDNGGENFTEYLGLRNKHGQVKLYNKQLESKLPMPRTRLEVTLEYEKSTYTEFKRLFPTVFVLDGLPDELTGTDRVLCLACLEHPDYLRQLGRRLGKKIETLLAEASQVIMPDEISYKSILSEILQFGKGIPIERFEELHDIEENPFPAPILPAADVHEGQLKFERGKHYGE